MNKVIAIEFDGCICTNAFPNVGKPNWGIIANALSEQKEGASLILWTNREGEQLQQAVTACREWGLNFDAVNDSIEVHTDDLSNPVVRVGATEYWNANTAAVRFGNAVYTHDVAAKIVELFDNVLRKNNIKVPSPEDDQREADNDAALYGSVYGCLLDDVENMLIELLKHGRDKEIVPYVFSGIC